MGKMLKITIVVIWKEPLQWQKILIQHSAVQEHNVDLK